MSLQHKKYQHKSIFYCHGRLAQHIPFFLDDDKPNPILLPFLQTLYCHPWLEVFYCNICQGTWGLCSHCRRIRKQLDLHDLQQIKRHHQCNGQSLHASIQRPCKPISSQQHQHLEWFQTQDILQSFTECCSP